MDRERQTNHEKLPDWLLTLLVCPVDHGELKSAEGNAGVHGVRAALPDT